MYPSPPLITYVPSAVNCASCSAHPSASSPGSTSLPIRRTAHSPPSSRHSASPLSSTTPPSSSDLVITLVSSHPGCSARTARTYAACSSLATTTHTGSSAPILASTAECSSPMLLGRSTSIARSILGALRDTQSSTLSNPLLSGSNTPTRSPTICVSTLPSTSCIVIVALPSAPTSCRAQTSTGLALEVPGTRYMPTSAT